ncbi:MAG: ACT domain-containing protein [Pseudobutyrivibrio ruminis]|nr:ACT domain-containing protein [Pseudobutyrivibrio ruminis]MBO6128635.1 ACT domain-containing protein [Pseudobutyrivibrio sp.]
MENKVIITVVGKDTVGIIAKICTYLADKGVNVLDITQTIVQGFFNMMMIVDITGSTRSFDELQKDLEQLGDEIGVQVKAQKEEIFEKMHRL